MEVDKNKLRVSNLVLAVVLLSAFLNPAVEGYETSYQWLFMLAHYGLFLGGLSLTYRLVKGTPLLLLPSGFIVVLWHLPLYFSLAAAFPTYRALNDVTLALAGALAGAAGGSLSTMWKFSLIVLWMAVDSAYSLVFFSGDPLYSNEVYRFSPYPPTQEIYTAITMWVVMSAVIAYIIAKFVNYMIS